MLRCKSCAVCFVDGYWSTYIPSVVLCKLIPSFTNMFSFSCPTRALTQPTHITIVSSSSLVVQHPFLIILHIYLYDNLNNAFLILHKPQQHRLPRPPLYEPKNCYCLLHASWQTWVFPNTPNESYLKCIYAPLSLGTSSYDVLALSWFWMVFCPLEGFQK